MLMDIKLNQSRYDYTFTFLADLPGENGTGVASRKFIRQARWQPAKATLHGIMVGDDLFPWKYPQPWQLEDVAFILKHGSVWISRPWEHSELHHFDLECLVHTDQVVMLRFASSRYKSRLDWVLPDEDDPAELGWFVSHHKPHRYAHLVTDDLRLYAHPGHKKTAIFRARHRQSRLQIPESGKSESPQGRMRLVK